jgi:hypothetical protein
MSETETSYIVGLDLGQKSDPSALTVVEKQIRAETRVKTRVSGPDQRGGKVTDRSRPRYNLVHLDRFELGTPYPEVVRQTAAVVRAEETGPDPTLVLDATGLGQPVVDQFHEEGLRPVEILFTGADEVTRDGRRYKVPKKDLATTVQALLGSDRLRIAEGLPLAGQLVTELKNFRVKITDAGRARFEHASESDHDDTVLSLAMATWYGNRQHGKRPSSATAGGDRGFSQIRRERQDLIRNR